MFNIAEQNPLVSDISFVSTGRAYTLGSATIGSQPYIDRNYRIGSLPELLQGQQLIVTSNQDDAISTNNHLQFQLSSAANVIVAFENSGTNPPNWIDGSWQPVSGTITAGRAGTFKLYQKSFDSEANVVLGGNNRAQTGSVSNYFVIVAPEEIQLPPLGQSPPPNPNPESPDIASLAITATNASQVEGDSGTKAFTFTVTREGNTSDPASVQWTTTSIGSNPATSSDFENGILPEGSLSFAAGQTSKTITINVQGDNILELDESFTVSLTNPTNGALITTSSAIGTILNDDTTLRIMPMGDSITHGHNVPGGYRNPLYMICLQQMDTLSTLLAENRKRMTSPQIRIIGEFQE